MDCQELRITLAKGPEKSLAIVTATTPLGELPPNTIHIPVQRERVEEVLAGIPRAHKDWVRRSLGFPDSLDPAKEMGKVLFTALFQGSLLAHYTHSLWMAERSGKDLRVRLVIEEPELALLPWEFLYDVTRQDFVVLSASSPLVRQRQQTAPPQVLEPVPPPLRVLVVTADSPGDPGTQEELQCLSKVARDSSALELEVLEAASPAKLFAILQEKPFHVLHYISHGFDLSSTTWTDSDPVLRLRDEEARPLVRASQLREHLRGQADLRLIVLMSCHTAAIAHELSQAVPAVVGINTLITDEAAWVFSEETYRALAVGLSVEAAVKRGRQALAGTFAGAREWGLPVLYLQAREGVLLSPPSATKVPSPSEYSWDAELAAVEAEKDSERRKWRFQLAIHRRNLALLNGKEATRTTGMLHTVASQIRHTQKKISELEKHLSGD